MEWLEVAARSVEDAKKMALDRLGVHESDAELEIVTEGRIGLFGKVREEARVRARIMPTPVRPKRVRGRQSRRSRSSAKRSGNAGGGRADAGRGRSGESRRPAPANPGSASGGGSVGRPELSLDEQADLAESFVRGIAEVLDITLDFTRHDVKDGVMRIEAHGDDIGILIGKRGTTAKAIDDLVRTVLQRSGGTTRVGKIRVDIGGVTARRSAALSDFARNVASEVLESGQEIRIEPMSRMDRKVVHGVVAKIGGVSSRSEGNDSLRHVVVEVAPEDF